MEKCVHCGEAEATIEIWCKPCAIQLGEEYMQEFYRLQKEKGTRKYKFLVSRTLTSEIEIEATDIKEAKAQVREEVTHMTNSDFDEVYEETLELSACPEDDEDCFEEQGIEII